MHFETARNSKCHFSKRFHIQQKERFPLLSMRHLYSLQWYEEIYEDTRKNCWILISSHDVHAQLLKYKNHKNCVWTIRAKKLFVLNMVYPGMGIVDIYLLSIKLDWWVSIVHAVCRLVWANSVARSIFGNFSMDIFIIRFVWHFFLFRFACLKVQKK